jgi:hypothetical protein
MRFLNLSRKAKAVTVTPTEVIKAPSPRAMVMENLARGFTKKAWIVLHERGIKATPQKVFYAPRYIGIGFTLARPTEISRATDVTTRQAMALATGLPGQTAGVPWEQVNNAIYFQFPLPHPITLERKMVPNQYLGLGPSNKPVGLSLRVPHTLIAGITGSGKSMLLDNILWALYHIGHKQSWYLVDPQFDHSFWADTKFMALPPAEEPDEIMEVLVKVAEICRQRIQSRKRTRTGFEPVYLIVDEAEGREAMAGSEQLRLGNEIAEKGRKANVHLIFSTHRPANADLRGIVDAAGQRLLGKTSSAHHSGGFGAGLNLHLLGEEGDFLYCFGGGHIRFQVCYLPEDLIHTLPKVEKVPEFGGVPIPPRPASAPVVSLARAPLVPVRNTGRPTIEPEPKYVAFYIYHGAESVPPSLVDELFDLKQTGHARNKDWALEIEKYFRILQDNEGRYP